MKNNIKNLLLASGMAALAGCNVGPDYVAPAFEPAKGELSQERFYRDDGLWKEATPMEAMPRGEWWKIFGDSELDRLVDLCAKNNPNLSAAFYRAEQARQAARIDESDFYPQLGGDASFSRTTVSPNAARTYPQFDNWSTGFLMTWDLDLFGRIRSIVDADVADAQASLEAYNSLMLSMKAQVARLYFTMRRYSSEIELLDRTLDVRKEQTDLVRRRVKLDFASDLDLQRAVQQEAEAAAQLASVIRARSVARNNMAILIGTTPSKLEFDEKPLGEELPRLPAAVPSELLERRPDIAAAERKVYAANARIGAAQAGFYPTVSITANTDLAADKLDKLINSSSFAWGISPQIYIPIFQAGRIYAQKQVALAAHKETLENYKATVLNAIGQVENSLSNINNLKSEYERRKEVSAASKKVYELTAKQYELGFVDYFSVSDASRLALISEREQISLYGGRFIACVDLIESLGGGWKLSDSKTAEKPSMYEKISERE